MKRTIVTLGATTILTLSLAACGGTDEAASTAADKPAEQTTATTEPTEATETTEPADTSATDAPSTGGSFTASIDGEPFTIDDALVVCQDQGGTMKIAIGPSDPSGDDQAIAVMIDSSGNVTTLAMGSASGKNLAVANGQGSAKATVDGSTYDIKGEGMVVDASNPTAQPENKPFELKVECP